MKFKDALTENKKRKDFRGSGETANEKKDGKKIEGRQETGSSLRELKTGRLVLTN